MGSTRDRCHAASLFAALLSVLLLAPLALRSQGQSASLEGQVRTDKSRSIPTGAIVMLESTEGERVEQQPANSDGRFAFDNLRKTNYRLTVTAEGFQTSQQEVNLSVGANRYFVHVLFTLPAAHISPTGRRLPQP